MLEIMSTLFCFWILSGFVILYLACKNPDWTSEIGKKARRENKFISIKALKFSLLFVAACCAGPLWLLFPETRRMIKENNRSVEKE